MDCPRDEQQDDKKKSGAWAHALCWDGGNGHVLDPNSTVLCAHWYSYTKSHLEIDTRYVMLALAEEGSLAFHRCDSAAAFSVARMLQLSLGKPTPQIFDKDARGCDIAATVEMDVAGTLGQHVGRESFNSEPPKMLGDSNLQQVRINIW